MLLRRRLDRLAHEMQLLGENGQLARVRKRQLSVNAHDVTQVEQPSQLEVRIANLLLADEDLDITRPVANVQKDQLAGGTLQHNAPRGPHLRSNDRPGSLLALPFPEIKSGCLHVGQCDVRTIVQPIDHFTRPSPQIANPLPIVESTTPGINSGRGNPPHLVSPGSFVHALAADRLVTFQWLRHGSLCNLSSHRFCKYKIPVPGISRNRPPKSCWFPEPAQRDRIAATRTAAL